MKHITNGHIDIADAVLRGMIVGIVLVYLGNTHGSKSGLISSKQFDPRRMVSGSQRAGSTEEDLIKPEPIYLPDS